MWLIPALLLALGSWQGAPAPALAKDTSPATFRWARGIVTELSPSAITLKLRTGSVSVQLDPAVTAIGSATAGEKPSVGAIVEVHYTDKKSVRRAVIVLVDGPGGSTELSRKPGHSYRGVTKGKTGGTLKLILGKRLASVQLDSHTRLVDQHGKTVATGKKLVGPLLLPGEDVLVKFDEDDDTVMVGDAVTPSSTKKALEVRRLKKDI